MHGRVESFDDGGDAVGRKIERQDKTYGEQVAARTCDDLGERAAHVPPKRGRNYFLQGGEQCRLKIAYRNKGNDGEKKQDGWKQRQEKVVRHRRGAQCKFALKKSLKEKYQNCEEWDAIKTRQHYFSQLAYAEGCAVAQKDNDALVALAGNVMVTFERVHDVLLMMVQRFQTHVEAFYLMGQRT